MAQRLAELKPAKYAIEEGAKSGSLFTYMIRDDDKMPDNVADLEAIWLDEVDDRSTPMGSRGIGEIGLVGAAAAIANAVYHATGTGVRDLPLTPDKLVR